MVSYAYIVKQKPGGVVVRDVSMKETEFRDRETIHMLDRGAIQHEVHRP